MKMNRGISTKIFTNPLYMYAVGFIVAMFVYGLRWSDFYEALNSELITFIIISAIVSILAGYLVKNKSVFRPIPESRHNLKIFGFIVLGNALEYLYARSIPLITVVLGGIGNYHDFEGIPTFHVFLFGVSVFFAVYVFHQYQSNPKNKKLLWYALLSYVPFLLNLNRGGILLLLLPSLFIYLMRLKRLRFKTIFLGVLGFLLFIFAFGLVGNVRDSASQENENLILQVGGASEEFVDSNIPKSLYWAYLYIASPLGNLNNAVEYARPKPSFKNFRSLVLEQTNPDFVSKRLPENLRERIDEEYYLVTPVLNAPTVYFIPYLLMGWNGIIYIFVFMVFVVYGYTIVVRSDSVYFITGWSLLITVNLLNMFNNMWFFNGLYLVTIPVLLSVLKRIRIKKISHV